MSLTLALAPNKSSNQKNNPQKLSKNRRDKESIRGAFTWLQISKYNIPSIVRVINGERLRFVSVRMAETNLLKKYLPSLHSDLLELVFVKFYLMTHYEAKLFNEINKIHSNNFYGENSFSTNDYIVRFEDIYEFYEFIEFCYTKLFYNIIPDCKEKCGFIRINIKSVVPYIIKDSIKYIPLLYFDFLDKNLTLQCVEIKDWSLAYLKFCCKVQGISANLYSNGFCRMISIDVIKRYFSPKAHFEEFWPDVFNKSQLINDDTVAKESGSWIRRPLVVASVTENTTTHSSKTPVISHSMQAIKNVQELKENKMGLSEIQQGSNAVNTIVEVPQLPPPPPPSPPTSTAFSILNTGKNSCVASEMIDLTSPSSSPAPNNQGEKAYTPISDVQLKRKSEQLLHGTSKKNSYKGLSEIQQGSNAVNTIVEVPQLPPPSPPPAIPLFRIDNVETQNTDSQTVIPQSMTALTNIHGIQDNQMGLAITSQGSSLMNNVNCILQLPPPPPALPIFQVGRVETQNIEDMEINLADVISQTSIPHPTTQQDTVFHPNTSILKKKRMKEEMFHGTPRNGAYKMYETIIHGKKIYCINSVPYCNKNLLVSLEFLVREHFPMCSVERCADILTNQFKIALWKANKDQLSLLLIKRSKVLMNPKFRMMVSLQDIKSVFLQLKSIL